MSFSSIRSILLAVKTNCPFPVYRARSTRGAIAIALMLVTSQHVVGQTENDKEDATETPIADKVVEEVIVYSTRADKALDELTRSARVFTEEDLKKFNQQTTSVQEILGKTIPGFAPPVTEGSAGSLTLRGRDPLFLIDGVPIASNTNFTRFLDKFDPLTIGRTEVVYGPTSLYGAGATGGVIQLFTREPSEEGLEYSLGLQFRLYATGDEALGQDGFSPKVNASISGQVTDALSIFAYLSYEDVNGVFSARDELITGRSAFVNDTTYFLKARYDFSETQSITGIVNGTELESASRQFELAGAGNPFGGQVATEADVVFSYAQPPTNEFLYTAFKYGHTDFFGGSLTALAYYSDSEFLNPGSDTRPLIAAGIFPAEWPGLWQSGRINEEFGLRGDYFKDFGEKLSVSVGFDYNTVDSTSLLPISTEEGFDETRFYDAAISAVQTPPFTLDAVGVFVEASYDLTSLVTLTGGIRWDRFDYEVIGPYDVVFFLPPISLPGSRPGGEGDADGFSYNVGIAYDMADEAALFANFSQGFAIPSLGFIGNAVDPGVEISSSDLVDPVITDSVEVGLRGAYARASYEAAVYYTESEFETTVVIGARTGLTARTRAPVRIWGLEFSGDLELTDRLSINGSVTWVEGESDPFDTGDFIALSTQDVPPLKLSLNPNFQISEDWSVFGQLFFVDDRDDGFKAGTDPRASSDYFLVDIGTNLNLDFGERGSGVLNFQVTNLFNLNYIPSGEITFIPGRVRPGPGRSISMSYQHTF
ncbi:MAG: TonB-dependent receptor [Pseudomonadota bacterium]